jgi:hypothetical protein
MRFDRLVTQMTEDRLHDARTYRRCRYGPVPDWPDAYASKTQLRTLHRRVKAWRAERVREMVLGSLRQCAETPTEV